MARVLCATAGRVLPGLGADERAPALEAIARFVDDPRPLAFLAAHGALAEAARSRAAERGAGERFETALAQLPPELRAPLAALPRDRRTAARLDALAALASAHDELSARAAAAAAAMRARLRR
jgi:hypothetical protein